MPPKSSLRSNSLRSNRVKEEGTSRSNSGFCHYNLNKHFYGGSILDIIRFWQREKQKKTKSITLKVDNLPLEPFQPHSHQASLKLDDSLLQSTVVQQQSTTVQNKNVFRVKLLYRAQFLKQEEFKERDVQNISQLNVESKRMSNRGNQNHPFDRSPKKTSKHIDTYAHTFYRFHPAQQVSIRKTSVTNEQEVVIGPW